MAPKEPTAVPFPEFGGLRLDQALDQVGANASIYEHDIERDGSIGNFRSRDGFQKLNASAGTGEYKGLWPHSALRLLAIRRVSGTEVKAVALDKEGTVKAESAALSPTEAPSTFASIGVPATSYTYLRTNVTTQKVVRFDGTTFTEPPATIANVNKETGEKEAELTGKEMPKARHMVAWPDAGNVLVFANTTTTGGPNGAASSNSHVWFSKPGEPEKFEESAFIRLGVGDGEEITGICVYGAQLYVFKESKFWVVSPPTANEHGQPVFSFREVTLGSGSRIKQVLTEKLKETSDRICWASQDGVFFSTTDGIYQTVGSSPSKISTQLKPLEETVPFEGPMYEFLNGSSESFRWPAVGICALGRKLFVKRYEFMFVYDIPIETWTCWKMPSVSMCIWIGLTGGGGEVTPVSRPGTVADAAGVGTLSWIGPTNAQGTPSTGKYAEGSEGPGQTHYLKATKFGFAVPSGASIVGIQVSVQRMKANSVNNVTDASVRIVKGGAIKEAVNYASAEAWPFDPSLNGVVKTYGSPEDLWGNSWLYSDINSPEFGVALSANEQAGTSAFVFGFAITVYYLTAESSSGVRPRLFCSQSKAVFWTGPSATEEATFPGWAWQSGLYDLGSQDEKELVKAKLWGAGTIKVATSKDFKAITERKTLTMGEATTQKSQNISDKATLFSHRFEGTGKASVQRFVRYLRTTATAGSQSDQS